MYINYELTKNDVWVLTTDNMTGEECETTLNDKIFEELEIWVYKMTAYNIRFYRDLKSILVKVKIEII